MNEHDGEPIGIAPWLFARLTEEQILRALDILQPILAQLMRRNLEASRRPTLMRVPTPGD